MRSREEIIEQWMLRVVANNRVDMYDELHIDQVDEKWKPKQFWIEGALEAFRLALSLRERNRVQSTLALIMSLKSGRKPRGIDFETQEELARELDWSPPSLYLFSPTRDPWAEAERAKREGAIRVDSISIVEPNVLGITTVAFKRAYHEEWRRVGDRQYGRIVVIEG